MAADESRGDQRSESRAQALPYRLQNEGGKQDSHAPLDQDGRGGESPQVGQSCGQRPEANMLGGKRQGGEYQRNEDARIGRERCGHHQHVGPVGPKAQADEASDDAGGQEHPLNGSDSRSEQLTDQKQNGGKSQVDEKLPR